MRLARANAFGVGQIRLCANGGVAKCAAKSRNGRRNSHEVKDRNARYINCSIRGGGRAPANKLSLGSRACCCEEKGSWRDDLWAFKGRFLWNGHCGLEQGSRHTSGAFRPD